VQDCTIDQNNKDCMACRFNKCTSIGMSTELMQVSKVGIQGSIPSGFLISAKVVFMLLLHVKIKGGLSSKKFRT
jgi:hypothetical protein